MALTNTTTLNDLVGQVVAKFAASAAYSARVMRPLVTWREVPVGYNSIVMPRFQKITVGALTEATAPTGHALASDGVTLTPVERGALITMSKTVLRADPFADLLPYGKELGKAMAEDEDALIIAAMDPATVINEQGGGAANTDLDDFLTAIGALEAQNAPGPYFAVYHPVSWAKLRKELGDAATYASVGRTIAEGFGTGFTQLNGYVGAPFGVPTFISTQIDGTKDTNSTYTNLMFSQAACGYAFTKEIGVDVDDNVPARAFDLMGWYAGDAGALVDLYSVQIQDDIDG